MFYNVYFVLSILSLCVLIIAIISLIIISYKNYQVFKSFIIKLAILSTIGIVVGISLHDNQPSKYVVDSKDIYYEDAPIAVDYSDTTVQPEIHITFEKEHS